MVRLLRTHSEKTICTPVSWCCCHRPVWGSSFLCLSSSSNKKQAYRHRLLREVAQH